jgi:uncharacterized membrane protein YbjE (DUF340 family)
MQTILRSILPILIVLAAGYFAGKCLPQPASRWIGKSITPLVWLLLFSIGGEFGQVLGAVSAAAETIYVATVFAVLTTVIPWCMISFSFKPSGHEGEKPASSGRSALLGPLKECGIALTMVSCGVLVSRLGPHAGSVIEWLPSTETLLYVLIFMVGVDMVGVKLGLVWRSPQVLAIPGLVVVGSLVGGVIASFSVGEDIKTALALASGFGWFTLSGVLVSSKLGASYGAIALMTDLFRELIAIVLLYTSGTRFSRACIGASGATALDSTLPIIKQTCAPASFPIALVSGFILTLLAPFLISFFLS